MHANDNESELTPPVDLPTDPAEFWKGEPSYEAPPEVECDSSLKRLGPFPLPRGNRSGRSVTTIACTSQATGTASAAACATPSDFGRISVSSSTATT